MEEIVKIYEISIVTRPLFRHRYFFSESIIQRDLPEKYKERSSVLKNIVYGETSFSSDDKTEDSAGIESNVDFRKRERFRRMKPKFSLYEEVIDKEALLEDKISELINKDGYYDIIQPYDEGREVVIRQERNLRPIFLVIGLLAVSLVVLVVYIKEHLLW